VTVKQLAEKLRRVRRPAKPQFVIEHEGRLFVSRSLTEIDPTDRAGGRPAGPRLDEIRDRLRHEESSVRAARYIPGPGDSEVEKLLSGTLETRGTISELEEGSSFAATNPPTE
jgi:hypothetical protein